MTTIAIAGGTDGLGLTIVEALAVYGRHNVVILSRKVATILFLSVLLDFTS